MPQGPWPEGTHGPLVTTFLKSARPIRKGIGKGFMSFNTLKRSLSLVTGLYCAAHAVMLHHRAPCQSGMRAAINR